jgi:serine/threonine protein kinase
MIEHMDCRRVKEREIHFDSHLSGFVYKVQVHGRLLIKKEIPGPDTVDEFLYEINALHQLCPAKNVIEFYGIVVDDREEHVTGLLISYASQGALIDVIFDNDHSLPWSTREKWARQIVGGLSEIHEAGFVQGDFTLSNIVIDKNYDAKIIDINRRGCPIGWEPPEATPLVESNQRISMYIGVKSDLYQLGMVLWALATQEDDPDAYSRPLKLDPDIQVPAWYRCIVSTCLSTEPRDRVQAIQLLSWFPEPEEESQYGGVTGSAVSVNGNGNARHDYLSPSGLPRIKAVHPQSDWAFVGWSNHPADEPFYYPSRGRSPPSPMPSNQGDHDPGRIGHQLYTWSESYNRAPTVPSVGDVLARESRGKAMSAGPQGSEETLETYADGPYRFRGAVTETSKDGEASAQRGRSEQRKYDGEGTEQVVDGDRGSILASKQNPPPLPRSIGEEGHAAGGGDGVQNQGHTKPGSQADSGKDLTERASTPREHRGYFAGNRERSVSRGRSGKTSTESATRQNVQQRTIITTATEQSTHDLPVGANNGYHDGEARTDRDGHPHTHGNELNATPKPPVPDPPPVAHTKFERANDDLKGVGSALGPINIDDRDANRRHEINIDEDLGSELEKGLGEVPATTNDRR